tara:strand:+ start:5549 stop:6505 length:957 start_codon:yes stop_codon:yes gene_type:complete
MATSKILTETKLIALNSKSGKILNNTKKSRVLFDFAKITDKSADILYMNVAVKSAEIPSSFYNITEHNNVLDVKLIGINDYAITIPVSNYNATTFIDTFVALFLSTTSKNITMTFNENSGKFNITPVENFDLIIENTSTLNTLGVGTLNSSSIVPQTFSYGQSANNDMKFPANFLGSLQVKVLSEKLAGTNMDSVGLKTSTLIDTFGITAPFGGLTVYNSLGRECSIKTNRIEEIDIELKNEDDYFIDFNNSDWCITLIVNIFRQVELPPLDIGTGFSSIVVNDKYERFKKAGEVKKLPSTKKQLEDLDLDEDNILFE